MAANHYTGPECRVEQRRAGSDRRAAIRFELNKSPRRSCNDRRNHGKSIWDGQGRF